MAESFKKDVSVEDLLDAGLHFGHQTKRWNPKMKRFIFGAKNGIYIIDLTKTLSQLKLAQMFLNDVILRGQKVLFVGTKKQAREICQEKAESLEQPYVIHRWLGGMLTNNKTIRTSVVRMRELQKMVEDGSMDKLPKKEVSVLRRELNKLERNLTGIADMEKPPGAVFIVDICREKLAIAEAKRLNIPVVALVDTNADPEEVDYPIPGNDDSLRSIGLIADVLGETIKEAHDIYTAKAKAEKEAREKAEAEERERARIAREERQKKEAEEKKKREEVLKKIKAEKKKADAKKKAEEKAGESKAEAAAEAPVEEAKEEKPKAKKKTAKKAEAKEEAPAETPVEEPVKDAKEEKPKAKKKTAKKAEAKEETAEEAPAEEPAEEVKEEKAKAKKKTAKKAEAKEETPEEAPAEEPAEEVKEEEAKPKAKKKTAKKAEPKEESAEEAPAEEPAEKVKEEAPAEEPEKVEEAPAEEAEAEDKKED